MCSRYGYNCNCIVFVVDEGHREEERNFFLPELFGVTSFFGVFPGIFENCFSWEISKIIST
nr:MAG TPA: hypothetical protein [Caudoviricetes sp.]